MRTKVKVASPEVALARILEALGRELINASDEEVMEAAKDLSMNPQMRGSAAFAGLKYPAKPQLADFFEFETCRNAHAERIADATPTEPKRKARQSQRFESSREKKDSADK
jgi:hypothetical protein